MYILTQNLKLYCLKTESFVTLFVIMLAGEFKVIYTDRIFKNLSSFGLTFIVTDWTS